MRHVIIWVAMLLLCGFLMSELRWPSPTTITLRFMAYGMPEGMYEAAVVAAAMWRSSSLEIRVVPEGYNGKTNGRIMFGGPVALGHGIMGTIHRMGIQSRQLMGCDVTVSAGDVPWHLSQEPPPPDHTDAITDFAHEFGHCIGLLHEDSATPPALMRTRIPYGAYHRTLTTDDLAARDRLFPQEQWLGLLGCSKR